MAKEKNTKVEKTTKEFTQIFTDFVNLRNEKTNEYDYEHRVRFYQQKTLKNYEELKSRKSRQSDIVEIHYYDFYDKEKNEFVNELRLTDIVKVSANNLDVTDMAQMLEYMQRMNAALDSVDVTYAHIEKHYVMQTGNIEISSKVIIRVAIH